MPDDLLQSIQKDYALIDKVANEFLPMLTGSDIKKDIMLAAEMCGLKLVRASKVDLSKIPAGTPVLGLVPDETYDTLETFILSWAHSNSLTPRAAADIPKDDMAYLPELTAYETSFDDLCKQNSIDARYVPFVAATTALKLLAAGEKMKSIDTSLGVTTIIFHIIAGSKTVPYPAL
jgi:hypothetical protein